MYVGPPRRGPSSGYYTAAVCRRGHVESSIVELQESIATRCQRCGAQVLTNCPQCKAPIRGNPVGIAMPFEPNDFCTVCGGPFPWASQESIAFHIENTLEEQPDLTEGDRRARCKPNSRLCASRRLHRKSRVARSRRWRLLSGSHRRLGR